MTSQLTNFGTMVIETGDGDGDYGILMEIFEMTITNGGMLKTDRIGITVRYNRNADIFLLHGSTTGAATEGKALSITNKEYGWDYHLLHLGGVQQSDGSIATVEGGSKLTISSGLTIAPITLNLRDDVTLAMEGDLTIAAGVRMKRNGHTLTVDNGNEVHTVTFSGTFSAAWDHALALTYGSDDSYAKPDGISWTDSSGSTPTSLTLNSGTLSVYGSGSAAAKAPATVTLKSGSLKVRGDAAELFDLANMSFDLSTTTGTAAALSLAPYAGSAGLSIGIESTKLSYSGSAAGQKVVDVSTPQGLRFTGEKGETRLYDEGSKLYHYYGYQQWVDRNSKAGNFRTASGAGLVIYNNDLYYSQQQTTKQSRLDNAAETTWRGGQFSVYDAEKTGVQFNASNDKYNQTDAGYCQLAVALNMAEYWLDRYAVLNTAARDLPYTVSSGAGALNSAGACRPSGTGGSVYDLYSDAWMLCRNSEGNSNAVTTYALGWILTGANYGFSTPSSMNEFYGGNAPFAADTWDRVSPMTFGAFSGMSAGSGKLYCIAAANNSDGIISNPDAVSHAFSEGFAASDAPLSIRYLGFDEGSATVKSQHFVTCWGYDSSVIDGKTYVTRLWYTDSDDRNQSSGGLSAFNVVYAEDGRVYLVDPDRKDASTRINYLTHVEFFTTPAGMDEMLADYYNPDKPIYWTGTNTVWKVDNIGGEQSQTRLATLGDGWRRECSDEAGTRSIWAYTTFSGSGEDVVFGEAVNGQRVVNRKLALADGISAGTVRILGEGYEWTADGGSGRVAMEELNVNDGSLTIDKSLAVNAEKGVVVLSGAKLVNHGLIEGDVTLMAGSSFLTGTLALSRDAAEGSVALGDGWFGLVSGRGLAEGADISLVTESSASQPYTLGSVVDFGGATISTSLCKAVENGTLEGLAELAHLGVFHEAAAGEYVQWAFEASNYETQGVVDSFRDVFRIRDAEVRVEASDESEKNRLTLGSYSVGGNVSAANLQLNEQDGGTIHAAEVALETVAGESSYVNADSLVESQVLRVVAGSELKNDGALLCRVEVDGTLRGTGDFGDVTAFEGSRIVVGGSPGAAEYESLTLKDGAEIVFSVDGLEPAAEGVSGWGSGAHSVLTLVGPGGLSLEAGAEVKLAFSSDFLTSAQLGSPQTLTLMYGVAADEALLAALQAATGFYYARPDDSLEALEEATLYSVHEFEWLAGADGGIALNVTLYYAGRGAAVGGSVPEPTTTTLSLLALAALAARRRRRG